MSSVAPTSVQHQKPSPIYQTSSTKIHPVQPQTLSFTPQVFPNNCVCLLKEHGNYPCHFNVINIDYIFLLCWRELFQFPVENWERNSQNNCLQQHRNWITIQLKLKWHLKQKMVAWTTFLSLHASVPSKLSAKSH